MHNQLYTSVLFHIINSTRLRKKLRFGMPGRPLCEIRRLNSEELSNIDPDRSETDGELDCSIGTDHMENPAANIDVDDTMDLI